MVAENDHGNRFTAAFETSVILHTLYVVFNAGRYILFTTSCAADNSIYFNCSPIKADIMRVIDLKYVGQMCPYP